MTAAKRACDTANSVSIDGQPRTFPGPDRKKVSGVQLPMRWTCPKGHERPLEANVEAVRAQVSMLALTHHCQVCDTSYLLPHETQHRVLRHIEEHAVRDLLRDCTVSVRGRWWGVEFSRLRLIARFPPDAGEIEVVASADEAAPRVRLAVRVPLDVLRSLELLKQRLRVELERHLARQA